MSLGYCIDVSDRTFRVIIDFHMFHSEENFSIYWRFLSNISNGSPTYSINDSFYMLQVFPCYKRMNSFRMTENLRLQAIKDVHTTERAVLKYPEVLLKIGQQNYKTPQIH